jgi:hypothetical protein
MPVRHLFCRNLFSRNDGLSGLAGRQIRESYFLSSEVGRSTREGRGDLGSTKSSEVGAGELGSGSRCSLELMVKNFKS